MLKINIVREKCVKLLFWCIPLFIVTSTAHAQISLGGPSKIETDLPTIIPPSPTVSSLMRFEEVPVDMYTGVPNISIPLYSRNIYQNLNLNLSLNYNPMGIRVDERSGWTGTGWSLSAESVVSRTVLDVPDEISTTLGTGDDVIGDVGTFSNNFYDLCQIDFANASQAQLDEWDEFVWETTNGLEHQDSKPDLFQFSFFGYSGRFIVLNINGVLEPKIISSDQKVKVELNYTTNNLNTAEDAYTLNSFEIIDPYGTKFIFSKKETTVSESISFGTNQIGGLISPSASSPPKIMEYTSSWKLEHIVSPNNEVVATYDYDNVVEIFDTALDIEKNKLKLFNGNMPAALLGPLGSANAGIMPPSYMASGSKLTIQSKKLSKITLRDSTEIYFKRPNVDSHPEFSAYTSCTLSGIDVKDTNGVIYKKYDFEYYTNPNGRLFLNKIKDVSNQSITLPYDLTYENRDELPEFGDDNKDIWGYYKGTQNNNNQQYYEAKAKTGVLKNILFPTGGKKEFDFELNQIGFVGQSAVDVYSLKENKVMAPPAFQSFSGNVNGGGMTQPLAQRLFFEVNTATSGEITYQTIGAISNQIIYGSHNVLLSKVTLNNPNAVPQTENDIASEIIVRDYNVHFDNSPQTGTVSLSPGWYMIKVYTSAPYLMADPGLPNQPNHTILNVDVTMRYGSFIYNTRNLRGGGLRIKSIRFTENNNEKVKVDYNYDLHTEPSPSFPMNPNPNNPNMPLSSGAFEGSILMTRTYDKVMDLITPVSCNGIFDAINWSTPTEYEFTVTRILNAVTGQMTKGNYVGYKNVSVSKTGNGRIDYEYSNSLDYPTYDQFYYLLTPAYFDKPVPDQDHKKGLLLKESVFNENNDTLKVTINEYDFYDVVTYNYKYTFYYGNCPTDRFFSHYQDYASQTANTDSYCAVNGAVGTTVNCGSPANYIPLINAQHIWGKTFLKNSLIKEYLYDSGNVQNIAETRQEFFYNPLNFQIRQQDTYFDESGVEQHIQNKYFYPVGPNLNSNSTSTENALIALNKINEVLETQSFRNGVKINETHSIYHPFDTNHILPKQIKAGKGNNAPAERLEFVAYDTYGNPTEVRKTDGVSIAYLYGFNGTVPVAKITNASHSAVAGYFNGNTNFTGNLTSAQETMLRNNLPNALISFYRYNPLTGVISTEDEKGYEITYEYDDFNRLARVKDEDGKIVSENKYNYQNQY